MSKSKTYDYINTLLQCKGFTLIDKLRKKHSLAMEGFPIK